MTPEKVLSVLAMYEARFDILLIPATRIDPNKSFGHCSREELLGHARHLIVTTRTHLDNNDLEKAHRHFGSLQTILSLLDWFTLNQLMSHNRSAP